MNQAVVDPEQLRQFAGHLHRFADELQQRAAGIASQMNQLEQTWRDEQQRKFAAEFSEQMRQMTRLIKTTEQHVPYLMRKAEQIDAYFRALIQCQPVTFAVSILWSLFTVVWSN